MKILKAIGRWVGAYGMRSALFSFAFMVGFVITFGSPDIIKQSFDESGVYQIPLSDIASSSLDKNPNQDSSGLTIKSPEVKESLENVFPEDKKQQIVEEIIDGTYEWLAGKAPAPAFNIDLKTEKSEFITQITDKGFDRVNSLRECSLEELQSMQELDPFSIPCKPPYDLSADKQTYLEELNKSDFLGDLSLSGDQLVEEARRNDSSNMIDSLPTLFQLFMLLPLILAGLILIFGAMLIYLHDTKKIGVQKIGKTLVYSAVSVLIVTIGSYFILGEVQAGFTKDPDNQLGAGFESIINSLRTSLLVPPFILALVYLLASVSIAYFTKWKHARQNKPKIEQADDSTVPGNSVQNMTDEEKRAMIAKLSASSNSEKNDSN